MKSSTSLRKIASLLALGLGIGLSLATSPPPGEAEPPTRATLTVVMGAGETTKAVRVLATGFWIRFGLSAPVEVSGAFESDMPLDVRACPGSELSSCLYNPIDGFADFVVRYSRPPPAANPITIVVTVEVSGRSRVSSDFGPATALGVDLELVP